MLMFIHTSVFVGIYRVLIGEKPVIPREILFQFAFHTMWSGDVAEGFFFLPPAGIPPRIR